jgi:hypothetical protein
MKPIHSLSAQSTLDLFAGPLKAVRFPDLDAQTLTDAVESLQEATLAVVAAEASLEAAKRAQADKSEALDRACDRALAYARVYAIERPELREVIESAMPSKRASGRPRKSRRTKPSEAVELAAE